MRKQGGFIFRSGVTLYVLVAAVLAFAGLSLAVAYYKNSAERADAEATLARDQRDRAIRLAQASEEARAKEYQRAEDLAKVGEQLEKDNQDLKDQNKRDVAAVRAGELRLRVANACPGPSSAPAAGATASERDDATTAELPREVAEDLLSLANDADEVVNQLSACQKTIREYLR